MRRSIFIALATVAVLAGCEPATQAAPSEPEQVPVNPAGGPVNVELDNEGSADDAIHDAVLNAANTTLSEQVGAEAAIQPEIFRSEGDWAFVYGPVRQPDGSAFDWSATNFAHQADEGMMDGDLGVVLLNWNDGAWRVVEAVVGPTDVPQAGWPDEHHVSPALVGMEGG